MDTFHLQEGKHYLSYDMWPCLKNWYDVQERKKSILLTRDLARISWGFQDPLDLFSLGAPASLIAEAGLWPLVWSCPYPLLRPLPESTRGSLCSVVCTDNSHSTVWAKCYTGSACTSVKYCWIVPKEIEEHYFKLSRS